MNSFPVSAFLPGVLAFMVSVAVASPPQEQPPPQFRTEVAAVLVDVLVLDEQGRPMSGLTREDFEVYEDGVRQEIQNFDVIDWTSYVAAAAPREEQKRSLPPESAAINTFPRRFIFIINRQGAEFGFMLRARKALERFVVESMADGDEAMVVDMGESTRILRQFTPLKEEVLSSLKKIYPMQANVFFGSQIATRNVYETLEGLGESLSAFPGRKIVLFMSPRLSRTQHLLPDLEDTVDALNQSNTTIYSINIEGTGGPRADEGFREPATPRGVDDRDLPGSLDSIEIGGLFPLAAETGGRYYYNLNTFEPAVQRIGVENERYYLLSYTPTNTSLDKKYRRIEVRVNRPKVTVKARRGYFARKAEKPAVADSVEALPAAPKPGASPAAPAKPSAPPPSPSLGGPRPPQQVEITNYLFPRGDGTVEVPIAVALPLELLVDDKGRRAARSLKLTVTDGSGATVADITQEVDETEFSAVRSVVLAPGSYLLRIALEEAGKTLYHASTQLDVPSGVGERFGLSSIAPLLAPPETSSARKAPSFRPTSSLRAGEDVLLHFRIFPGKRGGPSKKAQVVYSIYREDQEILTLKQPDTLDLTKGQASGFPVLALLPTSKLSPGSYRIVVRISDPQRGRKASGEIELTITP